MRKPKSAYLIRSVGRALDLLEAFTEHDGSLGLTDLAKRLGIHKNNAFRLLATLETRGYVTQELGTGRYRLGLKLYQLGQHVQRLLSPAREARPILQDLVRHCDETAYLGILDDASVVYVAMVETTQAIRVAPRRGSPLTGRFSSRFSHPRGLTRRFRNLRSRIRMSCVVGSRNRRSAATTSRMKIRRQGSGGLPRPSGMRKGR